MEGGWHPDPSGRFELRYWDGTRWTEHVSQGGRQFTDPVDAVGAPHDATGIAPGAPAHESTQRIFQAPTTAVTPAPRRRWYKRTGPWVLLGVLFLLVVAGIAGAIGGDDKTDNVTAGKGASRSGSTVEEPRGNGSTGKYHNPGVLFAARPDQQEEDQERLIGQGAQLSGYTAIVQQAGFQQSLSEFETNGYMAISVSIGNRDDSAQSYNTFDWKLQTPNGQVIDPTFSSADQLGSGDLVHNGKVSGTVVFEVGATKGDFYIIYKPDPFDASRGIWKTTV